MGSKASGGGALVISRLSRVASRTVKAATLLSTPAIVACAVIGSQGTSSLAVPVPVFLPGESVDCLFEVIGEVTVQGPFEVPDDIDGGSRQPILDRVRLDVGREGAESGANAVMIREIQYDENSTATRASRPLITAVEGMLLSFVDPACVAGQ